MATAIDTARQSIAIVRQRTDSIIVGYSGGKDSQIIMRLVMEAKFKRVVGFFMYLVENQEHCTKFIRWAEKQYQIPIHLVPHWVGLNNRIDGVMRTRSHAFWNEESGLPEMKLEQIERHVRRMFGIRWIAYGWRATDAPFRRCVIWKTFGVDFKRSRVLPIAFWRRDHIRQAVRLLKLKLPPRYILARAKDATGFGIVPSALLYAKNHDHATMKSVRRSFPFAEAMTKREEFYGRNSKPLPKDPF